MTEIADRYRTVAATFTDRVGGVAPAAWSEPTPCTEWTVRDLVAHVVATHRRVTATLEGTDAPEVDANGDLPGQWLAATAAVAEALDDEMRAATTVGGMFGEQPFEMLVSRLLCADTLVHTWDLARASGQDEALDADAVDKAMAFLSPLDEAIRRPGGFGPSISSAPDADAQTRFLHFCGRAA